MKSGRSQSRTGFLLPKSHPSSSLSSNLQLLRPGLPRQDRLLPVSHKLSVPLQRQIQLARRRKDQEKGKFAIFVWNLVDEPLTEHIKIYQLGHER